MGLVFKPIYPNSQRILKGSQHGKTVGKNQLEVHNKKYIKVEECWEEFGGLSLL